MNCWKGVCKYEDEDKEMCKVDGKPCDMTVTPMRTGTSEYHCHQENNKELRDVNLDTMFLDNIPEEFHWLPFWSCQNICKWYDICVET